MVTNDHCTDAVILDLNMEGMTGLDTLHRIRKLAPGIPCILSSGDVTEHVDLPEEVAEGTRFLQKPYRAHALSDLVKEVLTTDV